jgi:hypothetical protein
LANAMPATVHSNSRPQSGQGRHSSDVGGIKRLRSDGGWLLASVGNIVASPASNQQIAPD